MKTIKLKNYLGLCFLIGLSACNESYPGLYAPVVDVDNPHPEVTSDRVPIKLSITDPAYSIVQKGLGSFDKWDDEANRERWRQADFYVYAYLANNHEFTGNINYAGEEINMALSNDYGDATPYCLVKNRKVKFTDASEPTLEWNDVVKDNAGVEQPYQPYYSFSYPDYMFNFFLYHVDDAETLSPITYENNRVVHHIGVDGTQDIISGYAHATDVDFDKLGDDEESKFLYENWPKMIYSTRAAHQGVHPKFFVEHLMTKMRFKVQGAKTQTRDIRVLSVRVNAKWKGHFTVARDWGGGWSWSEDQSRPFLGVEWEDTRRDMYVSTVNTPNFYGATLNEDNCIFNLDIKKDENRQPDGTSIPQELGEILLAPDTRYHIAIEYEVTNDPEYENLRFTANYSNVGFLEDDRLFEPGRYYDVTLLVYGPQAIVLQVDKIGMEWLPGNDIDGDNINDDIKYEED